MFPKRSSSASTFVSGRPRFDDVSPETPHTLTALVPSLWSTTIQRPWGTDPVQRIGRVHHNGRNRLRTTIRSVATSRASRYHRRAEEIVTPARIKPASERPAPNKATSAMKLSPAKSWVIELPRNTTTLPCRCTRSASNGGVRDLASTLLMGPHSYTPRSPPTTRP